MKLRMVTEEEVEAMAREAITAAREEVDSLNAHYSVDAINADKWWILFTGIIPQLVKATRMSAGTIDTISRQHAKFRVTLSVPAQVKDEDYPKLPQQVTDEFMKQVKERVVWK